MTHTDIDYSRVPEQWRGGLQRYFENGVPPGSGLQAVLANDLLSAVIWIYNGIDAAQLGTDLVALTRFLYNDVHGRANSAWGSREKVSAWLARGWKESA